MNVIAFVMNQQISHWYFPHSLKGNKSSKNRNHDLSIDHPNVHHTVPLLYVSLELLRTVVTRNSTHVFLFLGSTHAYGRIHGPLRQVVQRHFNNDQRLTEENVKVRTSHYLPR